MAALSLLEGGEDASVTVRAALAFIDECDRELERFPDGGPRLRAVDSPPSPEAAQSDVSSTPTTKQKLRNPSRDKKKQEIVTLRAQVNELTARLAQLQRSKCGLHARNSSSSGETVVHGVDIDGAASLQLCQLWRDVAHRHRRLRAQASTENVELRATIRRQLEVIQLMQKMLVKQTRVDRTLVARQRLPHILDGRAPPQDVVDELLGALSLPVNDTDRHAMSLNLLLLPRMQALQISPTRTRVTLVESCYIPFGAASAANVLWKGADKQCFVHNVYFKQRMQTPEQTLLRSYSAHQQFDGLVMKANGHQAARMYTVDDNVTIAYASVDMPSEIGEWRDAAGVTIYEKGWIMLTSPCPAAASSPSERSSELTLMQIYWEVTLDVALDVPDRNHHQRVLIDVMKRLREQHLGRTQQQIEDELLTAGRSHACSLSKDYEGTE